MNKYLKIASTPNDPKIIRIFNIVELYILPIMFLFVYLTAGGTAASDKSGVQVPCLEISSITKSSALADSLDDENYTILKYDKPCDIKTYRLYAMPLGNGHIGAMFSGKPSKEVILLNHDHLRPNFYKEKCDVPDPKLLNRIRKFYLNGKISKAQQLFDKLAMNAIGEKPPIKWAGCYLNSAHVVGDLIIQSNSSGKVSQYQRTLNLQKGLGRVKYRIGDIVFTRTYFVSEPDDLLVVNLKASKPGSINVKIGLRRDAHRNCTLDVSAEKTTIKMTGVYSEGTRFQACLNAINQSGSVRIVKAHEKNSKGALPMLSVKNADELTILCSIKVNNPLVPDHLKPHPAADAVKTDYKELLSRHVADHMRVMGRTALRLNVSEATPDSSTTGCLVRKARKGDVSPQLVEDIFQMGRYILVSSSRKGSLPSNLQGVWSYGFHPAWNLRYQLDFNQQMIYWIVNSTGLQECEMPLFDLIDSFVPAAKLFARDKFGCGGILFPVAIDEINIRYPSSGETTCVAGWLASHYWRHYQFTGDKRFLRKRAYPFMKQVGEFYEDYLFEDKNGRYVFLPSNSPENAPAGRQTRLTMNSTIDVAVAREIFRTLIQASKKLGVDGKKRLKWRKMIDKMPDYPIGPDGDLIEWNDPSAKEHQNHRHLSHLYPLFPGTEFTTERSPELVDAAIKAMRKRETAFKTQACGYTYSWLAALYARAGRGNEAYRNLSLFCKGFLTHDNLLSTISDQSGEHLGRTSHKHLIQIEASMGAAAAIVEMLLQSHGDLIRILPALPDAWSSGRVQGLCARGGFDIDIKWKHSRAQEICVTSRLGGPCRLKLSHPGTSLPQIFNGVKKLRAHKEPGGIFSFDTLPGRTYLVLTNSQEKEAK